MALMERVAALIRANLNDLIDQAEDPEKMLKQVMVDMENQLIQVKTQVAVAMADEHLLVKRQQENAERQGEWLRKAELAVDKGDDALARAALERSEICRQTGEALDDQLFDQRTQAETLQTALRKLEHKLVEARNRVERRGGKRVDLAEETLDEKFATLERADRIEQLLSELKARRQI